MVTKEQLQRLAKQDNSIGELARAEIARRLKKKTDIQQAVDKAMEPQNLKTEFYNPLEGSCTGGLFRD